MIQSFSVSSWADWISKNLRFLHFEMTLSSDFTYLVFVEEYIYIYIYTVPSYFRIILNQGWLPTRLSCCEYWWHTADVCSRELPEVIRCSIWMEHLSRLSQLSSLHPRNRAFRSPWFLKRYGGSLLHIFPSYFTLIPHRRIDSTRPHSPSCHDKSKKLKIPSSLAMHAWSKSCTTKMDILYIILSIILKNT